MRGRGAVSAPRESGPSERRARTAPAQGSRLLRRLSLAPREGGARSLRCLPLATIATVIELGVGPGPARAAAAAPSPATAPAPEAAAAQTAPALSDEEEEQLRRLRGDIAALREGVRKLAGSESGILGALKSAEADALAKQEALAVAEERAARTLAERDACAARVASMDERLRETKVEVARRLDALYRMGRPRYLRVLLASNDATGLLSAYRMAAALSSRDARLIAEYRSQQESASLESTRLDALQPVLEQEVRASQEAAREAERSLEKRRALLRSVQNDKKMRQAALAELVAAEKSAGSLVAGLERSPGPVVSIEKLRSLLEWPASGRVSTPFGRGASPRSGTPVEHSGLDIDAPFGAEIRSVYDGTVVFAQWLRGYGLTVIVDHGSGFMSVYGHASVLMAQKGDRVRRDQKIALVGDSGSIRGPYLYFEIRRNGRPVDPEEWLKPR
jgi:septal ring factor EnvC (AmiA/AmiB activator)